MSVLSGLLNLLFPAACPICGAAPDSYRLSPFCSACWNSLQPYSGPLCRQCGVPLVSRLASTCEACIAETPHFDRVLFYGIYEGTLKEAIHLLKFGGVKRLAHPLGKLLCSLRGYEMADALIPVPLHRKRLISREFNQSALLAKYVGEQISVPVIPDALLKTRNTRPQSNTDGRSERLKNIKNAFEVMQDVRGKELVLVDDVITTGATIKECARVLMKAGAARVTVLALARSMPRVNT